MKMSPNVDRILKPKEERKFLYQDIDQALMKKNFWNLNNKLLTPGLDIAVDLL